MNSRRKNLSILVINDKITDAEIICDDLISAGYHSTKADIFENFNNLILEINPDLLMISCNTEMKELTREYDGYETLSGIYFYCHWCGRIYYEDKC